MVITFDNSDSAVQAYDLLRVSLYEDKKLLGMIGFFDRISFVVAWLLLVVSIFNQFLTNGKSSSFSNAASNFEAVHVTAQCLSSACVC